MHVLSEYFSKSHNFKNLVFCDVTLKYSMKAGVIYTQSAFVHTRGRLLFRVRILYPLRNA